MCFLSVRVCVSVPVYVRVCVCEGEQQRQTPLSDFWLCSLLILDVSLSLMVTLTRTHTLTYTQTDLCVCLCVWLVLPNTFRLWAAFTQHSARELNSWSDNAANAQCTSSPTTVAPLILPRSTPSFNCGASPSTSAPRHCNATNEFSHIGTNTYSPINNRRNWSWRRELIISSYSPWKHLHCECLHCLPASMLLNQHST